MESTVLECLGVRKALLSWWTAKSCKELNKFENLWIWIQSALCHCRLPHVILGLEVQLQLFPSRPSSWAHQASTSATSTVETGLHESCTSFYILLSFQNSPVNWHRPWKQSTLVWSNLPAPHSWQGLWSLPCFLTLWPRFHSRLIASRTPPGGSWRVVPDDSSRGPAIFLHQDSEIALTLTRTWASATPGRIHRQWHTETKSLSCNRETNIFWACSDYGR